jgi:hypothetical protein
LEFCPAEAYRHPEKAKCAEATLLMQRKLIALYGFEANGI